MIKAKIYVPIAHILYYLCNIKSSKRLTQINGKTSIMNLTFILRLIPSLRDEKKLSMQKSLSVSRFYWL